MRWSFSEVSALWFVVRTRQSRWLRPSSGIGIRSFVLRLSNAANAQHRSVPSILYPLSAPTRQRRNGQSEAATVPIDPPTRKGYGGRRTCRPTAPPSLVASWLSCFRPFSPRQGTEGRRQPSFLLTAKPQSGSRTKNAEGDKNLKSQKSHCNCF